MTSITLFFYKYDIFADNYPVQANYSVVYNYAVFMCCFFIMKDIINQRLESRNKTGTIMWWFFFIITYMVCKIWYHDYRLYSFNE